MTLLLSLSYSISSYFFVFFSSSYTAYSALASLIRAATYPPNFQKGECTCVVDPRAAESKQAWTCPDGFDLKYDNVKSKSGETKGMETPQYHCVAHVTKTVSMREPLVCPTSFEYVEREGGVAVCTKILSECTRNEEQPMDTESGVVAKADSCNCEENFEISCSKGSTLVPAKAGPHPAHCEWQVPVPTTIIKPPICKYTKYENLETQCHTSKTKVRKCSLFNKMSADAPQKAEAANFLEPDLIEGVAEPTSLDGKDWSLTYSVPMRCPMLLDIPPQALVCGPQGDAGIFKLINVLIGLQRITEGFGYSGDIWSSCKNQLVTIYARATEQAYDEINGGNGFTSAMDCTNYLLGSREKTKQDYQKCLRDSYFSKHFTYYDAKKKARTTKDNTCLAKTNSNEFSFVAKKTETNPDNIAKNLFESKTMGNQVLSKLGNFENIIRNGIATHPMRKMTKCLPSVVKDKDGHFQYGKKYWSHREADGHCEKNHKEIIDWDRTLGKLRKQVEAAVTQSDGLSTTAANNPFAIE